MKGFKESSINDIDKVLTSERKESCFVRIETGKSIKVRILPALEKFDEDSYLFKYHVHNFSFIVDPETGIQKKFLSVFCPKNHGEHCPFCEKSIKIYQKAKELEKVSPDKAKKLSDLNYRYFKASENIACRVIVKGGNEIQPKFLDMKRAMLKFIKMAFQEGKTPTHPAKGNYITMSKILKDPAKQDKYWNIEYTAMVGDEVVSFEEEQWEAILENAKPYKEVYKGNIKSEQAIKEIYKQINQKFIEELKQ